MDKKTTNPEPKIESILVTLASELPSKVREDNNLFQDGFVEIVVERVNPARTKIVELKDESPGKKFTRLLRESGVK